MLALASASGLTPGVRADEPREPYLPASLLRVVDGDTIRVRLHSGPITIRLHGIDTPEASHALGKAATKVLRSRVEGEPLEIEPVEQSDGYGRLVAKVRIRGDDVNARMVESGYAWAYRRYLRRQTADEHYCQLEADARAAGRGIWAGSPEQWRPPWELRAGQRGETAPRVSYAGETTERCVAAIGRQSTVATSAASAGATAPDAACRIKGNINGQGERIYHVPGAPSYADTRIDQGRGERWFCSVADAERAGWRAPRR